MARIKISPVEPLELEFRDGTVKTALFTNAAFAIFEEEFGAINEVAEEDAGTPFKFAAKLLYCGLKTVDNSTTLDEAQSIVYGGGLELLTEIMTAVADNLMAGFDDETKANFMKEVVAEIKESMKN